MREEFNNDAELFDACSPNERLVAAWDTINPSEASKERMLAAILAEDEALDKASFSAHEQRPVSLSGNSLNAARRSRARRQLLKRILPLAACLLLVAGVGVGVAANLFDSHMKDAAPATTLESTAMSTLAGSGDADAAAKGRSLEDAAEANGRVAGGETAGSTDTSTSHEFTDEELDLLSSAVNKSNVNHIYKTLVWDGITYEVAGVEDSLASEQGIPETLQDTEVAELLGRGSVSGNATPSTWDCEVYSMKYLEQGMALAVRFDGFEGYYLFTNVEQS